MESNRSKYILAGLTAFCILLIGITSLKMVLWNRSVLAWDTF